MGRDSFREGADDCSRGVCIDRKYNDEFSSYRLGWDTQQKENPMCLCGEEAQAGTDPPRCTECQEKEAVK